MCRNQANSHATLNMGPCQTPLLPFSGLRIEVPSQSSHSQFLVLSARLGARAHIRLFFSLSFCQSHVDLLQLLIREEENDVPWSQAEPVGKETLIEGHEALGAPRLQ